MPMRLLNSRLPLHRHLYFFLIFVSVFNLQAQYSITEFLESASTSPVVLNDAESLSQLQDINYSLPFFDGVELRTETRDLLLKRQEYAVRFKPNPIGAVFKQREVFKNKLEEKELENKINFNKQLRARYQTIINYVFIQKELELQQKRNLQLQDALLLLKESIYSTDFNVKDLVETEEQLFDNENTIIALNEQLLSYENVINLLSGTENTIIDTTDFIEPEKVINSPIDILENEDNLKITLQKLKLQTLDSEIALEKAKSRQLIDFVQAKYGGKRSVLFDENFSIGLGINLPFIGNNKKKRGDYQFEKTKEESELVSLKEEDKRRKQASLQAYKTAINNYQKLEGQTQKSSSKSVLNTYKETEGVLPITLLKLEILLLKKEISTTRAKEKMYNAYLNVLHDYEILYKEPHINYLSNTFQILSFQ